MALRFGGTACQNVLDALIALITLLKPNVTTGSEVIHHLIYGIRNGVNDELR